MRFCKFFAAGLVLAAVLALSIGSAQGQTTGPGPYYATPSWDQKLAASSRFLLLSNWSGQAVLDKETGLVWERSPSTSPSNWSDAHYFCNVISKGNRKGWRLPTSQELASLVNPSAVSPALPTGHPFRNVQLSYYWSATTASASDVAWVVNFGSGALLRAVKGNPTFLRWCVRGGQGVDPQ